MANGWKSMDTAPRDGTPLLLLVPNFTHSYQTTGKWVQVTNSGYYSGGPGWGQIGYQGIAERNGIGPIPTHWMPLPKPPKQENVDG